MVSPYKDPVKNHHMKEFVNKIIKGFFVLIFGILGFFSKSIMLNQNNTMF